MGATILLADDSVTIQKVIELTFAETDHRVVAVGSGRDLLDQVSAVQPDAVLCDVVMPDVNGYDICQALKSDPKTLHIPVVLLTGTFEPFDRTRALAAGCDAIVTKPFEAEELVRTVEELLQRGAPAKPTDAPGVQAVGVPEGVPSLDFTTTGFERMGAQPAAAAPPASEDGIEFEDSGVRREAATESVDGDEIAFGTGEASEPEDLENGGNELPHAEEAEVAHENVAFAPAVAEGEEEAAAESVAARHGRDPRAQPHSRTRGSRRTGLILAFRSPWRRERRGLVPLPAPTSRCGARREPAALGAVLRGSRCATRERRSRRRSPSRRTRSRLEKPLPRLTLDIVSRECTRKRKILERVALVLRPPLTEGLPEHRLVNSVK